MRDCVISEVSWPRRRGPLHMDREITFIRARKLGANPELDVNAHIAAEPSIDQRIAVKIWTVQCAVFTSILLREFSEPPEEAHDIELWKWFGERASGARPGH